MVQFLVALFLCMSAVLGHAAEPVHFPDSILKEAVEEELGVLDPTADDMLALTSLFSVNKPIKDIEGLDYAVNLRSLWIRFAEVTDISYLEGLTELQSLNLSQNMIDDLSPLAGLTNLVNLNLHGNDFSDISALEGLYNLEVLVLLKNTVDDISALEGLTNLEYLDVQENYRITDISSLANMTEITWLGLHYNKISDVSPLAGLPNLSDLDLFHNEVSDIYPLLDLPSLTSLDLRENPLDSLAYRSALAILERERPGIRLQYTPTNTPPISVKASDGTYDDRVRIIWSPVANGPHYTSYYQVLRQRSGETIQTSVGGWSSDLSFDDVTAEPGIEYSYRVQTSPFSNGADAGHPASLTEGGVPMCRRLTTGHSTWTMMALVIQVR